MLAAPDHVWSVGSPVGVAAFLPSGTVEGTPPVARNGPASLRLDGAPRLLAFETISADPFGWNHGVALCVTGRQPEGGGRIAPGGPDRGAIVPADRDRLAWDLGVGDGVTRVLVRPDDPTAMARREGLTWDEASDVAALPAVWIVETAIARIEQRHVAGTLPVHRLGTTPPATTPMPSGWSAAAHVFPPHPARARLGLPAEFDPGRHAAFQALLAKHGRPDLWRLKQRVQALLARGRFEAMPVDRHGMAVIRVALRQAMAQDGAPPPERWLRHYDPALLRALGGCSELTGEGAGRIAGSAKDWRSL